MIRLNNEISKGVKISLLICALGLWLGDYFLGNWLGFFNLDRERNLVGVLSGALFAYTSFSFLFSYRLCRMKQEADKVSRFWNRLELLAAVIFGWLAIDEMMVIHERATGVINLKLGLVAIKGAEFFWLIWYLPLMVVGLGVMALLIRFAESRTEKRYWLAAIGLFIFALILETLAALGQHFGWRILSGRPLLASLEEISEFLGNACAALGAEIRWRFSVSAYGASLLAEDKTEPIKRV